MLCALNRTFDVPKQGVLPAKALQIRTVVFADDHAFVGVGQVCGGNEAGNAIGRFQALPRVGIRFRNGRKTLAAIATAETEYC
jgi:hypothetical protein